MTAPSHETYTTRKSVLEPETIWRLTPDSLVRERIGNPPSDRLIGIVKIACRVLFPWTSRRAPGSWPDRVPYREIASIRVRFDPTRLDLSRERFELSDENGNTVSIFSTRYVSPTRFVDETRTYRPFINELTRRVLQARPQTPVYAGASWTTYLLQHGAVLLALLGLASAMAVSVPAIDSLWAKIIVTLSYIGALGSYTKRNLPRTLNRD